MSASAKLVNGLDTTQMFETLDAIKKESSLARFNFRARNRWISGGHNRSTIQGFYGAGREDDSRTEPFEFDNGEPPMLLGNNEGANPVEFLLHAMAGCLTTTIALHAAARGITIRRLATELDGDIDLRGLLGLDDSVPASYEGIRIKLDIEADCSEDELNALVSFAEGHSPVCSSVCRPIPVVVERTVTASA